MQLWYAPTSPFARKVRIAAEELGLADGIELAEVDPWTDPRLRPLNPLGKVPVLVRGDGPPLYESAVICEYLDAVAGAGRLFPSPGEDRWRALLIQGLADGISTAAGRLFADERRPPEQRSEGMVRRLAAAVAFGLDALEADAADLSLDEPAIGEIAAAAALGYLDFRWADRDWRLPRPTLAAWFADFEQRPSMSRTRHQPPAAAP